jgi:hypothetical protein
MNNQDVFPEETNQEPEKSRKFDRSKFLRDAEPVSQKRAPEGKIEESLDQQSEKFNRQKYQRKEAPGPERHVTRTASRVGETIAGLPGNMVKFSKFIGELLPEPPKFLQKDPNFIQKYGKKALEMIPTSEDLKKSSQDYFGLWTTPQGETEKMADEFVETFTNLMIPIGQQQSFLRTAAAAGGGVVAKQAAKELGAPEWAQESLKFGTTLGISMFNPGGARQYSNNLYHLADQALPDHITVPGQNLLQELTHLQTELARGGGQHASSSGAVLNWVNRIIDHITTNNGRLNVKEGQAFIRNINEAMGDPQMLRRARELFPRVNTMVRDTMEQVQATHPEYWNFFRNANESHGAIAQGTQLGHRVEQAIQKSPLKSNLGILMTSASYDPRLAVGLGLGRAMIEATDILSQMYRSPVLRNYYLRMLQQAANNDKNGLINTVQAMDKAALKEEKKNSLEHANDSIKIANKRKR